MNIRHLHANQADELYTSLLNNFYNKDYLSQCVFDGSFDNLPEKIKNTLHKTTNFKLNKNHLTINCFQEHSRPLGMHGYKCKRSQTVMLCPNKPVHGGRVMFLKTTAFDPHHAHYSQEDMELVSFAHGKIIESKGELPRMMEYIDSSPSPVIYLNLEQNE